MDIKEARLYVAVLESGRLTVSDAAKRAFISRTNAYDVVRRLTSRGLIQVVETSDGGRARSLLEANDPRMLLQEHRATHQRLQALVPALRAVQPKGALPRVRYLEGSHGIRTALFESLEWPSPIHGILSMADLLVVPGQEAMAEYVAERGRRELWLKAIRSPMTERGLDWSDDPSAFRELRLAPPQNLFTMTTMIGRHSVAMLSSRHENFAMVIDSDEYADQQRQLFNVMWQACSPPPQDGTS